MSKREEIAENIKTFLEIQDYHRAKTMSVGILEDLEEEGFPVYKNKDSKETPYSEIFDNYLTVPFIPHPSPNSEPFGWIMYALTL